MPQHARIALFIPNFEAGGAERVMIKLARGLVERGHNVDLLVLSDHGPYRKDTGDGVRVVNLGVTRALFGIFPLIVYLRKTRPDVLLSAIFHANFTAVLAGRLSRTKTRIVISEHNTLELIRSAVNYFQWRLFLFAMKTTYPFADAVVCVSKGVAAGLKAVMPSLRPTLSVVPNPVITDDLLCMSERALEHPWLAPSHPKLVLAVGRLVPAKGFDILIEAFATVTKAQPTKLMILGEGPERLALQSLVDRLGLSEDVCLHGYTDNPFAWMRHADLFVLSSRHEGLPGVLIEAMACGCKVVSTDCPHGPNEILEHGKWGRLAPVENASALADAILSELNSPKNVNCAPRVQAFHLSRVVFQYEKLLLPHFEN